MPTPSPCVPCCGTTQTVNVPGVQGDPGNNGSDGINAFSYVAANFSVPGAPGDTVTVTVTNTTWMVVGQRVIVGQGAGSALAFPGPATFQVSAINSSTSVDLDWLNYSGDVAAGTQISAAAVVSPSSGQFSTPIAVANGGTGASSAGDALTNLGASSPTNLPYSSYGSGAAYTVTGSQAQVIMGSGAVAITITRPGTYLVLARMRFEYNGATISTSRIITSNVRRTNNTAANQISALWNTVDDITLKSWTAFEQVMPPLLYTTLNADDVLTLYVDRSGALDAGSITVAEAEIVAIKLY